MPSPRTVLGWLLRRVPDVLVVAVAVLVLGEVYLRSYLGRQHEYGPDPVLGACFQPGQEAARGRVNADGHRGPETDWSRPALVGLGDSQAFGSGVADADVWTARLAALTGWQVVNAAHPGFGPYQQSVALERVFARGGSSVRAVLVRVSIEDRNFTPPAPHSLPAIQRDTESRARVRSWTRMAPYLMSKAQQQWPAIASVVRWSSPGAGRPIDEAVGERMWDEQSRWWRDMADRCERLGVPVVFFVHDPTDLPSNRVLERNLAEMASGRPLLSVVRLDSAAWGLMPGATDQLWAQYHGRYTLQHDHHGNEAHHALVARVLAGVLRERGIVADDGAVATARIP